MIDAEFRSEERFSRLSIAYESQEEKKKVNECVDSIVAKHTMKPEMYTTAVSHGKEVLVTEYHDDISRKAGDIFDEIIHSLDIKICT